MKGTLALLFVSHWKQWKWGLLRLAEARALVKALRASHVEQRDGGLMGVGVGKPKKKQVVVDGLLAKAEADVAQAELLSYSLQFQLRALRVDMMEAVRRSEMEVEVWTQEVEELYAFYRRDGYKPHWTRKTLKIVGGWCPRWRWQFSHLHEIFLEVGQLRSRPRVKKWKKKRCSP